MKDEDTLARRLREMRAAFDLMASEFIMMTLARFRRMLAWLKRGGQRDV